MPSTAQPKVDHKLLEQQRKIYWLEMIKLWEEVAHKTTKAEFCLQYDLNKDQFYYWRKKLNKQTAVTKVETDNAGKFINLTPAKLASTNGTTAKTPPHPNMVSPGLAEQQIEITLPNDITVKINASLANLGLIVKQLGGIQC